MCHVLFFSLDYIIFLTLIEGLGLPKFALENHLKMCLNEVILIV